MRSPSILPLRICKSWALHISISLFPIWLTFLSQFLRLVGSVRVGGSSDSSLLLSSVSQNSVTSPVREFRSPISKKGVTRLCDVSNSVDISS